MRVAIAIDGSEHAERAFENYLQMWHKAENEIFLLHALNMALTANFTDVTPATLSQACEQVVRDAHALQAIFEKKLADNGMRGKWSSVENHSNIGESIVRAANEKGVDMIVIGSRGQGTIRRTLLGSVSDYVIHHSVVPVIVCNPDKHNNKHHKTEKHHKQNKRHVYDKQVVYEDHFEQKI